MQEKRGEIRDGDTPPEANANTLEAHLLKRAVECVCTSCKCEKSKQKQEKITPPEPPAE